jgi:hypothetical protein
MHHDFCDRQDRSVFFTIIGSILLITFNYSLVYAESYVRSTTNNGIETQWADYCIPIYLHDLGSQRLNLDRIQNDLVKALQMWNDPNCSHLALGFSGLTSNGEVGYDVTQLDQNQNLVRFHSQREAWYYDPLALALTTLTICQTDNEFCLAGDIIDADIELNEAYFTITSSDETPVRIDLLNTLVHEFGHFIGFDHNFVTESSMYPAAPLGEIIKRDLVALDIEGLCDVYPSQMLDECLYNTNETMSVQSTPANEGCQQNNRATLEFFLLGFLVIHGFYRVRSSYLT